MPKRRVPSDEEDEASDNAQKNVSEEEVVKKSKKSSAKSEKPKASAAILTRVTPIDQPQFLTFVPRHNQPRNKRKRKKLLQSMRVSRLTKRESNILTLGATDEQRFASSKARHCSRCGSAKQK